VKSASNEAKVLRLVFSLGCKCYFIFASGVKNSTVIFKNCRNIFSCLIEMMKKEIIFHAIGVGNRRGGIYTPFEINPGSGVARVFATRGGLKNTVPYFCSKNF